MKLIEELSKGPSYVDSLTSLDLDALLCRAISALRAAEKMHNELLGWYGYAKESEDPMGNFTDPSTEEALAEWKAATE